MLSRALVPMQGLEDRILCPPVPLESKPVARRTAPRSRFGRPRLGKSPEPERDAYGLYPACTSEKGGQPTAPLRFKLVENGLAAIERPILTKGYVNAEPLLPLR
jgi:hypothetical protein